MKNSGEIKMYNQQEADCLRNIIRYHLEGDSLPAIPEGVTQERLFQIARENHIDFMVAEALLELGILDSSKEAEMRHHCFQRIFHSANQLHELERLQNAFEAEKVKNLPLKGAVLKFLYHKPEQRQMSDLDICVEEEELSHVQTIMETLGYQLVEQVKNHDVYYKSPNMEIEIHKCLYKKEVDKKQHDYFGGLERAIKDEGKEYCYHQTHEAFYIYMIAHMACHFYERGCGVRNLIDIYVYLKKFENIMDKAYVEKALQECGLTDFECYMRKLSFMWLKDGKIKEEFYQSLLGFMMDCGIYGKEQYGVWKEYAKQRDKEGGNSAQNMKVWYVFPPLRYMEKEFSTLKKLPVLLPVFWVFRIVRGIVCKRGLERREYLHTVDDGKVNIIQDIYFRMNFKFEEEKP